MSDNAPNPRTSVSRRDFVGTEKVALSSWTSDGFTYPALPGVPALPDPIAALVPPPPPLPDLP